jgi:hypothetical protein
MAATPPEIFKQADPQSPIIPPRRCVTGIGRARSGPVAHIGKVVTLSASMLSRLQSPPDSGTQAEHRAFLYHFAAQ